ncbi:MAG: arsenite methyltransferase, partial [Anaerolineae bacterium]
MDQQNVRQVVREGYARVARQGSSCCGPSRSCCGGASVAESVSKQIGYSDEEISSVPEGANLGLGCGNPVALASLKEGEVVLDLGSGAGFDCFLAAARVGASGKVIGVDMTPEMLERARANARRGGYTNVEFRLGEIESLPVADSSVDVVISNCVINLSPDKQRAFAEACRALKPGGRLMISDIVLLKQLPQEMRDSVAAYVGCLAGALMKDEYLSAIGAAGFQDITVVEETSYPVDGLLSGAGGDSILGELGLRPEQAQDIAGGIASIKVSAIKANARRYCG